MSEPRVAIVVPTLNEATHIGEVLATLGAQARESVAEILVVDGGSTDATRAIVAEHAARDTRIRLLDNPARRQSAAVNLAARVAGAGVTLLIRADAHSQYPPTFVQTLLDAHARTGADGVVNRLRSVGEGCFQRAVAAVSNSRFGTGGAVHRIGGESGYVDHGHHALFDRATFLRLGGYDETFVANEDAEYDTRLRGAGGRIWFAAESVIGYWPRETPGRLALQYFRYGQGRARTRDRHRERLRARQMVPPVLVLMLVAALVIAPFTRWALVVPFGYLSGIAAATALLVVRTRDRCVSGALIALPVMHLSWGVGFLLELFAPRRSRRATPAR